MNRQTARLKTDFFQFWIKSLDPLVENTIHLFVHNLTHYFLLERKRTQLHHGTGIHQTIVCVPCFILFATSKWVLV